MAQKVRDLIGNTSEKFTTLDPTRHNSTLLELRNQIGPDHETKCCQCQYEETRKLIYKKTNEIKDNLKTYKKILQPFEELKKKVMEEFNDKE